MFKKIIEKIRHKLKHAKKEQIANSEATEQRELIKKRINDVIKNDAIDAATYMHQAQEYPVNTYTMSDASQKMSESSKTAAEVIEAFSTLIKELEIFKEKVKKIMDCVITEENSIMFLCIEQWHILKLIKTKRGE